MHAPEPSRLPTLMTDRPTSIKDIARELGISYATVSRALSRDRRVSAKVTEETRKRVKRKAAQMDYSPNLNAQGMVTGRTGTLGLLACEIARETHGRLADHVLRAAGSHEYRILLDTSTGRDGPVSLDEQARQIKQFLARRVDGLLIDTSLIRGESNSIPEMVRGQVPVVTLTHPIADLGGVLVDETASFYEAAEHLIRLGHQRIGFVGADGIRTVLDSDGEEGYVQAMRKHGLSPRRMPGNSLPASPGQNPGARFTALVCRSDYTAMNVCRQLREAGLRVPEDVAVTGFGNISAGPCLTPALTSLAPPDEAMAQAAMDLMLEQLQGRPPRRVTFKCELLVRESCGAGAGRE